MRTLTKILDRAEHVLCNGFLVFHDFLNDHRLRESLFDALGHDGLGSAVEQLLLSVAESVRLNVAVQLADAVIGLPIVIACALLTRAEIAVRALIHLGSFLLLLIRALVGVKHVLGVSRGTGGHTKRVISLLCLLGPVVATLEALAERLAHGRSVLALLGVIESIGESIQVLSLDHNVDGVSSLSLATVRVALGQVGLTFLQAGVDHNLTGSIVVDLAVLPDVGRRASVASALVTVHFLSDGHVSVVTTSGNDVACSSDFRHGVGAHLSCGRSGALRSD